MIMFKVKQNSNRRFTILKNILNFERIIHQIKIVNNNKNKINSTISKLTSEKIKNFCY
jgi:hypothetical protein